MPYIFKINTDEHCQAVIDNGLTESGAKMFKVQSVFTLFCTQLILTVAWYKNGTNFIDYVYKFTLNVIIGLNIMGEMLRLLSLKSESIIHQQ